MNEFEHKMYSLAISAMNEPRLAYLALRFARNEPLIELLEYRLNERRGKLATFENMVEINALQSAIFALRVNGKVK